MRWTTLCIVLLGLFPFRTHGSSGNIDINSTISQLAARTTTASIHYTPELHHPDGVTLLYNGSRGSKIEPCGCRALNLGGIDKEAAIITSIKNGNRATLVLEAGGFFRGSMDADLRVQTWYLLEALRPIGYQVVNIGYKDLGPSGIDTLLHFRDTMHLPFISANVVDARTGSPIFPTHMTFTLDRKKGQQVKVGVIGVTSPNSNISHSGQSPDSAGAVSSASGLNSRWAIPHMLPMVRQRGGAGQGAAAGGRNSALAFGMNADAFRTSGTQYRMTDEIEAVRPVAESLRGECDVLILLSFAGQNRTQEIVDAVPVFDAAIVGDYQKRFEPYKSSPWNTLIMGTDQDGKYLGQIELAMDDQNQVTDRRGDLIPILQAYIPDSTITPYLESYQRDAQEIQLAASRKQREEKGDYVGARQCASCHSGPNMQWRETGHSVAMKSLVEKKMQFSADCLRCHTTGFGLGGFTDLRVSAQLASVQCESCHGPGGKHVAEERARATLAAEAKGTQERKAKMRMEFDANFCMSCHDSQNDPDFHFEKAIRLVDHKSSGSLAKH